MATYDQAERTIRIIEFRVPVNTESGACWTDVYAAVNAAHQRLVADGQLKAGEEAASDKIRIRAHNDDALVVSYVASDDRSIW